MVKKIEMANEILVLLKMKDIAENKAKQWKNEKAQFREDLEKFEEKLKDCEERCRLREQQVIALESKAGCEENVPVSVCPVTEQEIKYGEQTLSSSSLFSPQSECARQQITQILAKFDTNVSPISLFNKLEAVVKQYNLGNKDACALLRAWLPYQLAAELRRLVDKHIGTLSNINENWGDTTERLRELQRILVVFNCPDMLPDEPNFLYSMANKCNVDYNTRTALRYATSYNNFINTLRDWSQDSFEFQRHIYVASKNHQHRRFPQKCYGCGKYGHIARFCRTSAKQHGSSTYPIHSIQRQEGNAQENLNDYLLDHSPPPEPEIVVSSDNIDTDSNSAGNQKVTQTEPNREFHIPLFKTGKGTAVPPFMPWVANKCLYYINQRIQSFSWTSFEDSTPKKRKKRTASIVHKEQKPPIGRPIISGIGSLNENLSEWVDAHLQPLVLRMSIYNLMGGMLVGQFLGLRRNCYTDGGFHNLVEDTSNRFKEKSYNKMNIKRAFYKTDNMYRDTLLVLKHKKQIHSLIIISYILLRDIADSIIKHFMECNNMNLEYFSVQVIEQVKTGIRGGDILTRLRKQEVYWMFYRHCYL
ncbi:hypothetical protein XELAEV_18035340mg [Xenopus laevis]|uniref:CCHC-type domain-containing protein n=1 Tax=Xenopus laevis TaxID=8355 RepID=A0A974HC08_XENLA|nr:hypothetical protein XELAEV_18035340mg [Xenopus laevis]